MEDKELKHEFELERVILFSDAVFAIIITIMVLELKLPETLKGAEEHVISHAFKEVIVKFFAYLGSFFLVSSFWIRHLNIFKNLRDYDVPLVVRNLFFLFVISMFPFAISIITSGLTFNSYWTVDIYIGIVLTGIFAQALIVQYIVKHKHKLCFNPDAVEDRLKWNVIRITYFAYPVCIATVIALNLLQVYPPYVFYVVGVYAVIMRVANKKYYPHKKMLKAKAHTEELPAQTTA